MLFRKKFNRSDRDLLAFVIDWQQSISMNMIMNQLLKISKKPVRSMIEI